MSSSIQGNKMIYPVLYINLDRSADRQESIEHILNKYRINYARISAVDGRTLNLDLGDLKKVHSSDGINYINYINETHNGTVMQVACTLSHLKAIKIAYDNNLNIVVIMEDNTVISNIDKWPVTYQMVSENAPEDWDIIQMLTSNEWILRKGLQSLAHSTKEKESSVSHGSVQSYLSKDMYMRHDDKSRGYSTGCYIINRKGMSKLLNKYYDKVTDTFTLIGDQVVTDQLLYQDLMTYLYLLPTAYTNDRKFTSLIGKKRKKTVKDKTTTNIIKDYYKDKPFVCIL